MNREYECPNTVWIVVAISVFAAVAAVDVWLVHTCVLRNSFFCSLCSFWSPSFAHCRCLFHNFSCCSFTWCHDAIVLRFYFFLFSFQLIVLFYSGRRLYFTCAHAMHVCVRFMCTQQQFFVTIHVFFSGILLTITENILQ